MDRYNSEKLIKQLRALSEPRRDQDGLSRLMRVAGLLGMVFVGGTLGYWIICDQQYSLMTCAYMTVITLTSIGFSEVIPVTGHTDRVIFTIILVLLGLGIMLYFVSQLTAFVIDGELRDMFYRRKMRRAIKALDNHFIVAGLGSTGRYVLDEMLRSGKSCLIIEQDLTIIEELDADADVRFHRHIPSIQGDATDDDILIEAGIERAIGIVFALGSDRDNLFATITARSLNSDIRIITRGENPQSEQKFRRAGATSVVYTNVLGGLRMAAEVIRPEVTGFLDLMMRDHGEIRRIEELDIPDSSPLIGRTLREANFREHSDALIVAMFDKKTQDYNWNPGPNCRITSESKLILLTLVKDIPKLEAILSGKNPKAVSS